MTLARLSLDGLAVCVDHGRWHDLGCDGLVLEVRYSRVYSPLSPFVQLLGQHIQPYHGPGLPGAVSDRPLFELAGSFPAAWQAAAPVAHAAPAPEADAAIRALAVINPGYERGDRMPSWLSDCPPRYRETLVPAPAAYEEHEPRVARREVSGPAWTPAGIALADALHVLVVGDGCQRVGISKSSRVSSADVMGGVRLFSQCHPTVAATVLLYHASLGEAENLVKHLHLLHATTAFRPGRAR